MTSLEYYIESIEQFISMLTDDIESGEGTVVTQTKLAVYREVLEHLEETEREPSGDLISREGTLTAFANYVGSGMSMNDYDALWDIVAKMPAVKQEPKFMAKSDGTIEQVKNCDDCIFKKEWEKIGKLISVVLEKQIEQEPSYNSISAELNGDMISRQAVCKIIDDIRDCISVEGYWALLERLKKLPPVNPQTSGDLISRQSAIFLASDLNQDLPDDERIADMVMAHNEGILEYQTQLSLLPSVKPQYTEDEIQKMQDLEQAEIQKAYEIGKGERQIGHCKDCKFFEYDSVAKVDGIPLIVAHEICSRWGDGCKTKEDGYCFMFEPQERSE